MQKNLWYNNYNNYYNCKDGHRFFDSAVQTEKGE